MAVDKRCPQCGLELEDYFANADDWKILQDFVCDYKDGGAACGKCAQVSECNDIVECEHCGEWLDMYAEVRQPCGDNEQVTELRFSAQSSSKEDADVCPKCGSLMEWRQCASSCDDGFYSSRYDDDFDEEIVCPLCQGKGGYWECPLAHQHKPEGE